MNLGNSKIPNVKKKKLTLKSNLNSNNTTTNTTTTTKKSIKRIEDLDENNQTGSGKYRKINETKIGAKTKQILREFESKRLNKDVKRMTEEQYKNAVKFYNQFVEEYEASRKQDIKQLKQLPFVELGNTKEERKALQKKQFIANENKRQIKKYEDKFINMRIAGNKSITLPLNKKLSIADNLRNAINTIQNINKDQKFNLKVNGKHYALNDKTKDKLFKFIEDDALNYEVNNGSDAEIMYMLQDIGEFTLEVFEKAHKNQKHNGAFFKYLNKTKFELQRYQIFKKVLAETLDFPYWDIPYYLDFNTKGLYDNCLVYALRIGGLEPKKLDLLKLECNVDNIPLCKLNSICDKLEICIKVRREQLASSNKISKAFTETYGNEKYKTFNIGLLDEHYFINEPANITAFSITNYNEVKDLPEFHLIAHKNGIYYKKDKKRTLMSYDVIKLLLENKDTLLEPITKLDMTHNQLHRKLDNEIINLEYDAKENVNFKIIEVGDNAKEIQANRKNIYYDFETYTREETDDKGNKMNKHIPYLCCITDDDNNNGCFYGEECGLEMLKALEKKYENVRLIAHNASYDIRFLYKYLYDLKEICKGNRLMSCKAKFGKMKILLKDSYALITAPLSKFPKTFKIYNCVKEVISYDFYNKTDAVSKVYVKINDTIEFLKREGKSVRQFEENLKKWNLIKGDTYNCIEYSKRYCEMDCFILKEGYNTFKKWMLELVNINIDYVLTIASLAHRYFIEQGCYEGVYQLGGVAQAFIQKCVVGGRTMTANNNKIILSTFEKSRAKNTNETSGGFRINDFDAVSLYASAMYRMDGFLEGIPKVITNLDYEDLKTKDGFFVEIKIKSVGVKRTFPLASYITEEGIRNWNNDLEGKNLYIDKVALEDLIKFQKVEFDIIRGYYFDEGFNTNIKSVIEKIFNERKNLKKQGNPAEVVYKLIMNSGYGKSIMKEIETETKYFNNETEMNTFVSRNYNWVISWEQLADSKTFKVKIVKPLNDHFNIAQVGVSILSWSKRIMNEVICLAEDNGLPIYYQDTDSIHIDNENIEKLATLFSNKFGRELIGKELGQFHSDFEMLDYKTTDEEGFEKEISCKNVIALESIFLGKKCYIDKLEGETEKGEKKIDYHIRMKGVPNSCIKWTAEKLGYENVFELYKDLYNGKEIEFDLTEGGRKGNFKFNANGTIETLQEFKRLIKF